jgi:glutamate N-acetyltransferase / amino-acid N-acetyltransferase
MGKSFLTKPKGFRVAAVKAGIKSSGKLDLGLIVADRPCTVAATFTKNKIVAPAVLIDREKIQSGRAQAVFVNAGNANTCTGKRGVRDVHTIGREVGKCLDIDSDAVLVCSTGIIGEFLPMDKVRKGIKKAADSLSQTAKADQELAQAILTTDTCMKTALQHIQIGNQPARIAGIAKGSGMIAPNMATMLAFLTTDVNISPALLRRVLNRQVDLSFNKVSVDNHMSTSDTVLILASGLAQNSRITKADSNYRKFDKALGLVCDDLARQIAADGEGATCMVTVRVRGAANSQEATAAVRKIVESPLVRCAFNGADPNWGRIVSAVGYSGAKFNADKLSCKIADIPVFRSGKPYRFNAQALSRKMKAKQWDVVVDLGVGCYEDFCYTCDLSRGYVRINADYHT